MEGLREAALDTSDSKVRARAQFYKAARLWRRTGNRLNEAKALAHVGELDHTTGRYRPHTRTTEGVLYSTDRPGNLM